MSTTFDPKLVAPAGQPRFRLHQIPWSLYLALRAADDRRGVRMSYLDGTLELMSPEYLHDKAASRLERLIFIVAEELDIAYACTRTTTLKRPGGGATRGAGKEPDTTFYFAHEPSIRDKDEIDLNVDPPPDLAVEVDNTSDSARALPVYAALGVPEVWRYDVRSGSLWFGRLEDDGHYVPIERSDSLPRLTPALVLEGLALCQGVSELRWGRLLRDWVRVKLAGE